MVKGDEVGGILVPLPKERRGGRVCELMEREGGERRDRGGGGEGHAS